MFVGRQRELAELERRYKTPQFQMVILYGRRRVGKTRLIQEFCKGKSTVFTVGLQQSPQAALAGFSRDLLSQLPSESSGFIDGFRSWQDAFHYITQQANGKRLVLVIDEYPYLAQAEPSISSILQMVIDHEWKETDLYLILCGSSMSFMENQVLGYQSPLYGRRTAQMKIRPLRCWESAAFFPKWNWQERLYAYGVCGGIPQYLEYFAGYEDFASAVRGELLALSGHLAQEPTNLMQQEMREPAVYNSIIAAIAGGASRQSDIASAVGKDARDITSYLRSLLDLEILVKLQPIEVQKRNRAIYSLSDNLFRFWHHFIPACLPLMSMGMEELAWQERIKPKMDEYFGPVFEGICLEYVQRGVERGDIRPIYLAYGKWWGNNPQKKREEEIDVVAVTQDDILIGECKWRNEKMGTAVFELLKERGELIRRDRRMHYALFSKDGFSSALRALAKAEDILLVEAKYMG